MTPARRTSPRCFRQAHSAGEFRRRLGVRPFPALWYSIQFCCAAASSRSNASPSASQATRLRGCDSVSRHAVPPVPAAAHAAAAGVADRAQPRAPWSVIGTSTTALPGVMAPYFASAFGAFLMRQTFRALPRDYRGGRGASTARSIPGDRSGTCCCRMARARPAWPSPSSQVTAHWNEFLWPLIATSTAAINQALTVGLASFALGRRGAARRGALSPPAPFSWRVRCWCFGLVFQRRFGLVLCFLRHSNARGLFDGIDYPTRRSWEGHSPFQLLRLWVPRPRTPPSRPRSICFFRCRCRGCSRTR